jgi:hypothetical protein
MTAPAKTSHRLCRTCLGLFVPRGDGMIPRHRVLLPDGGTGAACRGAENPPREPGYGRRHHVIT